MAEDNPIRGDIVRRLVMKVSKFIASMCNISSVVGTDECIQFRRTSLASVEDRSICIDGINDQCIASMNITDILLMLSNLRDALRTAMRAYQGQNRRIFSGLISLVDDTISAI